MSRRKEVALVTAGILAGITVSGPASQAAAGLMANASSQRFYVNEQRLPLDAYEINGSNYVKLRDIGQMVGFNVYWDGQAVQIDSDAPYTGEAPAQGSAFIRVGSVKGSTLKEGITSALIISPRCSDYTVTSSNPTVANVAEVLGHWTVNTRSPGTAIIKVIAPNGQTGSVTITVESADPSSENTGSGANLNTNMDIRLEMIRLINQTRTANGVSELSVNEALMNAAQTAWCKILCKRNSTKSRRDAMENA